MNRKTITASLLAALVFGFGAARAQDPGAEEEGPDPAELARQIRRNMIKIEEDLSKAGSHDSKRGEQVKKDLEKLLDTMKQRQDQVIKDIDEIVKQFKSCDGGGGTGSKDSNENQKQSRARDRNKPQQQGKPRDPNSSEKEQAGKPKPKKPQNKKGGGAEDNRPKPMDEGQNNPADPRNESAVEKVAHVNLNEIWGNLPPELRQKLIDRNYDDFTPEYEAQIQEYFRKTSTPEKK